MSVTRSKPSQIRLRQPGERVDQVCVCHGHSLSRLLPVLPRAASVSHHQGVCAMTRGVEWDWGAMPRSLEVSDLASVWIPVLTACSLHHDIPTHEPYHCTASKPTSTQAAKRVGVNSCVRSSFRLSVLRLPGWQLWCHLANEVKTYYRPKQQSFLCGSEVVRVKRYLLVLIIIHRIANY